MSDLGEWKEAAHRAELASWDAAYRLVACATDLLANDHGTDIHIVGDQPMGVRYGGALLPRKSWIGGTVPDYGWTATAAALREALAIVPADKAGSQERDSLPSEWDVVTPQITVVAALLLVAREAEGSPFGIEPALLRFAARMKRMCAHDWTAKLGNGLRVRISAQRSRTGMSIAIRRLPSRIFEMDALGFGPETLARLKELARRENGLILNAGRVNSGKSSTINSMVEYGNRMEPRKVISIEDPVEQFYSVFGNQVRAQTQLREVGEDVPTFALGLEQGLRQDAQCLVVGEIRNREALDAALRACESGHLVYASVHATGCISALDRLALFFPPAEREQGLSILAGNLTAIVFQTLLRTRSFSEARRTAALSSGGQINSHESVLSQGKGANAGRRQLVYEYMEGTKDVKALVRNYAVQGAQFRLASFQEEITRPPHVLFLRSIEQVRDQLDPVAYEQAITNYKACNPH